MKKGTHPESYRIVVFKDISNDEMFLCRSCANSSEKVVYTDGNEYPLVKLEISSSSHPFFTGKMLTPKPSSPISLRDRFARSIATDLQPVLASQVDFSVHH